MSSAIEITNLRKTFGQKVAVADVSLSVEPGEIVGILGPNGAGKTTTVEILAGLQRPDSGTVRVLGIDPQADPVAVRQVLGVQLQESKLPAKIRVEEALHLYAAFYPEPADVDELIAMLGLTGSRRTAFDDLSGGLQQRLSIALALVGSPSVVILDELTTGLDPVGRRETWKLVEKVRDSGVTVLLVTHFMDEAEQLADRIVVIDAGRVVATGTPEELTAAGGAETELTLGLAGFLDEVTPGDETRDAEPSGVTTTAGVTGTRTDPVRALRELDGVTGVTRSGSTLRVTGGPRVLPDVVAALDGMGIVPAALNTRTRTLEDVFVDVTGREPEEVPA
ncbi:ABC transporter ATP-binding protein [Georgenia sp. Z1491]|uniref:ABC transporter ATP-binding protein n=1 Tax=Georgenia sp. Z1491 TaxID=3416707 RepID=UPI003CF20E63